MSHSSGNLPGRPLAGSLVLGLVLVLVVMDLLVAEPIDPYLAPYPVALGSGKAPSGAHCTAILSPPR